MADFGVAKLTSDAGARLPAWSGTYAPPEHHPDEDWIDPVELKDSEQPCQRERWRSRERRRRLTYAADIYREKRLHRCLRTRAKPVVRQQITSLPGIADEPGPVSYWGSPAGDRD